MPTTYVRKDGSVVKYDASLHNEAYRSRNTEPHWCQTCLKHISALTVPRHNRTEYHLKRLKPEPIVVKEEPVSNAKDKVSLPIIKPMTVKDLKMKAKELNLRGYSRLTKPQLEDLISRGSLVKDKEEPKEVKEEAGTPAIKTSKPNPWNVYLSQFAKEKGVSLKVAMKDAKEAWAEHKKTKI